MPGDDATDNKNEVAYDEDGEEEEEGEEGEEDDEEDEEDKEDVPPAAVKLEDIIPDNYDEDAATTAAMAASLADENANWPGYEDIVQLSAMVAQHVSSLPAHAPPLAVWDGQEVPAPPP
jgi:hypothetical protein